MKRSLSQELEARGFINQVAGGSLEEVLDGNTKRTIYLGIDPSADSIHAGNFMLFMLLRHLSDAGHKIIFLSGGGTGMIGDPKPDAERELKSLEAVQGNANKISEQAKRLLNLPTITFVNNYEWLSSISLLEFLRDIGKHFTVNELIKKDAIATRLSSEVGLSYTEFAYPLLQGYDYFVLHERFQCDVQVGGSDQWGNIVSGVDLIRKKTGNQTYAITAPLVVDKTTGKKFGKSEGNAVWLDSEKTSPFAFYQFWLQTSDENVIDYLKRFTLLSLEEIETLKVQIETSPEKREAQNQLAHSVTALVHGELLSQSCAHAAEVLFGGGSLGDLSVDELNVVKENAPLTMFKNKTLLLDVLVETTLASSKREARTFIESGAVSIDGKKILDVDTVCEGNVGDLRLVKRGKKNLCLIEID